ncbi:unnamed protein product [Cylindrotheca closterium]|uniref:Uncharacterized protein n=1 Tax=Cylindrotheca closterium TaxID=2856 RepID=A0AAD2FUT7_9STRA|nr:unnamed protein product [Cylindrotheca closterium]
MGQNISATLNPNNDPVIWLTGRSPCVESSPRFPFDDKPDEISDQGLWDRFGKGVDQHLPKLNPYLKPILILDVFAVICIFILFATTSSNWVGVALIPVFILFFVGMSINIEKNKAVDKSIEDLCGQYNVEFVKIGFSPVYRTMHTGLCKPKGARPTRMIVFRPASRV